MIYVTAIRYILAQTRKPDGWVRHVLPSLGNFVGYSLVVNISASGCGTARFLLCTRFMGCAVMVLRMMVQTRLS